MVLEKNGRPTVAEQEQWHALHMQEVLDHLKVEGNGLTTEEARKRLDQYGPNQLQEAPRPTFLKMDIEGAEPDALAGAAAILRDSAPTLAICLYHERCHLWRLPAQIHEANPKYRLFLRRHSDESWETVCYART